MTYLILIHHFAGPIRIFNVRLTEPSPGTGIAFGKYGQYLSKGYTYLRRADGKAFLPGSYHVRVNAELLDGTVVNYTGAVDIGHPLPQALPPASIVNPAVAITDTIGKAITYAP